MADEEIKKHLQQKKAEQYFKIQYQSTERIRIHQEKSQNNKYIINIANKGNMMGFEEIISNSNYEVQAKCISGEAVLYKMCQNDFLNIYNKDYVLSKILKDLMNEK